MSVRRSEDLGEKHSGERDISCEARARILCHGILTSNVFFYSLMRFRNFPCPGRIGSAFSILQNLEYGSKLPLLEFSVQSFQFPVIEA